MKRYYLTVRTGYTLYNYRVHDIWRLLNNDPNIKKVHCSSVQDLLAFIKKYHHKSTVCLLVYYYQHPDTFILDILDRVNEYTTFRMKLVFFTFDYWPRPDNPYNNIRKVIYKAKNHYVVTFAKNLSQLEDLHDMGYADYARKLIFFNLWCCYESSFVPFNENPINKICVSGAVSSAYPERIRLCKLQNVIRLPIKKTEVRTPNNIYNKRINEYIACFASSVHVHSLTTKKKVNTHLILLKVFEILAAGSLLLCPKSEKPCLKKMGLISMKNCILLAPHSSSLTIQYITNPNNREIIDGIRRQGQEYARNHLNSATRYAQLFTILESYLH
ncbi:hypothetical protein LCGC14_1758200 [marine sediment metagenome]|uniref:DUF3880 domain-containing protein n=1 Tax=marine sediment metagenome TaxID=412755 RepID=A0A0F9HP48_9ZZZZ